MQNIRYQHKQRGDLILIVLGIAILALALTQMALGFNWIGTGVILILFICLFLFATLTVTIDEEYIRLEFGIGLIRMRFPLQDIESCQSVKNPWYYSWGIHWFGRGWLYNVSGWQAVEITNSSGKVFRIGTDVPQELERAIRAVIAKR